MTRPQLRVNGVAGPRSTWNHATVPAAFQRPRRPDDGAAQPDRQVEPEAWNRVVAKRRYEYKPLDDAVYVARFRNLCFRYHPAVAAIMAHDVSNSMGCRDQRRPR